jgi:undecaprenyl-diphosphatase
MDSKAKPAKPEDEAPQQKLGDTPVAPWQMPTPDEKAKAEPVREALKQAVEKVDTPAKADQVAESLTRKAGDQTTGEVEHTEKTEQQAQGGDKLSESAAKVEQAAQATKGAPSPEKTSAVINETVHQIAGAEGREREALAQAAQEVLNPEQQGAAETRPRRLLRQAFIKRMKPYDALDAQIYLGINHLPHNRALNAFFYTLTVIFKGGLAWYGLLGVMLLARPKRAWPVVRKIAVPLALSSAVVEFPIKTFFRRKRPFITLIQATVIGKKPGSWSFPSGHSAAAFGGAFLFSRQFPRLRWLFYLTAALVAFSRIYLGDHYPGDVLTGTLSGITLSKGASDLQNALDKAQKKANPF